MPLEHRGRVRVASAAAEACGLPWRSVSVKAGCSMSDNRNDDVRNQVSRAQAEDAVRTLLRWSGDDPDREGLLDTPKRVSKAYED